MDVIRTKFNQIDAMKVVNAPMDNKIWFFSYNSIMQRGHDTLTLNNITYHSIMLIERSTFNKYKRKKMSKRRWLRERDDYAELLK